MNFTRLLKSGRQSSNAECAADFIPFSIQSRIGCPKRYIIQFVLPLLPRPSRRCRCSGVQEPPRQPGNKCSLPFRKCSAARAVAETPFFRAHRTSVGAQDVVSGAVQAVANVRVILHRHLQVTRVGSPGTELEFAL